MTTPAPDPCRLLAGSAGTPVGAHRKETTMGSSSASGIAPRTIEPGPAVHDFDFLPGTWRVHHRRLTQRLAGSDEWEQFEGTSVAHALLGGAGNIDDNV